MGSARKGEGMTRATAVNPRKLFLDERKADAEESQTANGGNCQAVIDYVIDLFTRRVYNEGDRLPPERELSEAIGTSRATVREAMKVLQYMGFVKSIQGSGNYIATDFSDSIGRTLRILYLRNDISNDEFASFRLALEREAFDYALDNVTDEQLQEMLQTVNLMDVTTDQSLINALDEHLHSLLVQASGNEIVILTHSALTGIREIYMRTYINIMVTIREGGYQELQKWHHGIVDALINHDREAGHKALEGHYTFQKKA